MDGESRGISAMPVPLHGTQFAYGIALRGDAMLYGSSGNSRDDGGSMAQHAVPKGIGHSELARPQFTRKSRRVVTQLS